MSDNNIILSILNSNNIKERLLEAIYQNKKHDILGVIQDYSRAVYIHNRSATKSNNGKYKGMETLELEDQNKSIARNIFIIMANLLIEGLTSTKTLKTLINCCVQYNPTGGLRDTPSIIAHNFTDDQIVRLCDILAQDEGYSLNDSFKKSRNDMLLYIQSDILYSTKKDEKEKKIILNNFLDTLKRDKDREGFIFALLLYCRDNFISYDPIKLIDMASVKPSKKQLSYICYLIYSDNDNNKMADDLIEEYQLDINTLIFQDNTLNWGSIYIIVDDRFEQNKEKKKSKTSLNLISKNVQAIDRIIKRYPDINLPLGTVTLALERMDLILPHMVSGDKNVDHLRARISKDILKLEMDSIIVDKTSIAKKNKI